MVRTFTTPGTTLGIIAHEVFDALAEIHPEYRYDLQRIIENAAQYKLDIYLPEEQHTWQPRLMLLFEADRLVVRIGKPRDAQDRALEYTDPALWDSLEQLILTQMSKSKSEN